MTRPIRERFEEKYLPEPNSGCWIWMGALNQLRESSEPVKSIAARYGIHWATVYKIRKGKLWSHI